MTTNRMPTGLPKKGETAFVHYWHEARPGSDVVVRAKDSPFKCTIVVVDFKEEGIMYIVRHLTDNFTHESHINDFVAMSDDSYPRMKLIAKADVLAQKMWVSFMEHF